jgi:hypothetical protein
MALEPSVGLVTHSTDDMDNAMSAAAQGRVLKRFESAVRRTFTEEIHGPAWVEGDGVVHALFYKDEIEPVRQATEVSFVRAKKGSPAIPVRLATYLPSPWDSSTARLQFHVDTKSRGPRAGEVGWVILPAQPRELLVIPVTALINSSEGPYVLTPISKDGRLAKRSLEIGKIFNGVAVVTSGLQVGQPVVANGTFFLDAARRLTTARDGAEDMP